MVRIGIAGSGLMAGQRAVALKAIKGVEVAGLFARTPEKARTICESADVKFYADYDGLLADVDAVCLCLPNDLHAPFALSALRKGRHVLVEYPACTSRKEARALDSAARKAGCVLMVGNTIIRETMFEHLMKHRARLGTLVSAASRSAFHSREMAGAWYMDPARSGSVFPSYHYHHIEYYRRFLGEVESVLARDESRPDPDRPGLRFMAGGTLVMGHVGGPSTLAQGRPEGTRMGGATSCVQWYLCGRGDGLSRGLWLTGDAGCVTVVSDSGTDEQCRVIWDNGGPGKSEVLTNDWGVRGSSEDFVAAIAGKLDHRARWASDLRTLAVGLAAAESARKGRSVRVSPVIGEDA